MALTQVDQGLLSSTAQYTGFKNRLINSAMVIDQRNNGAIVTPTTTADGFAVDRTLVGVSQNSKLTCQQSTTAPTGFSNSLLVTSSSAYAVLSSDSFYIQQKIEGFNTADLAFGTASASTVTLSFWVRSSLTGTFGGALSNSAANRSYPFTYTINSADTWEKETITIAGDTSGTWIGATNGIGMRVLFGLGVGSTGSGTAGAWAAGNFFSVTGATSVVGTNGATFYITGVQLEKGSTATSFDYRPYGTELALCQRYYYRWIPSSNATDLIANGYAYATSSCFVTVPFPVTMRIRPTALETSGTSSDYRVVYGSGSIAVCNSGPSFSNASYANGAVIPGTAVVLTANGGVVMQSATVNGYLGWSAEL
jgi:hypothetical protein